MNKYLKAFLMRGLLFGGFGPIISAIVLFILSFFTEDFVLTGQQVFTAVISTYLLAFVHAGASIFNQIEDWPIMKSLLCHMSVLYISYAICYLINSWIPFSLVAILIFTAIFVVTYLVIWFIVYLSIKATSRKLSRNLRV